MQIKKRTLVIHETAVWVHLQVNYGTVHKQSNVDSNSNRTSVKMNKREANTYLCYAF